MRKAEMRKAVGLCVRPCVTLCVIRLILLSLIFLQAPSAMAAKKIEAEKQSAKESLSDLHERIDALKQELDNAQAAHKDAADELKQSEQAISVANKSLFDISHQQQEKKGTLAQLKAQSLSLNSTLSQQQKLLSAQLYDQYLHGKQSYTQMVLQNQDPSKIARDLQYFSYVARARAKLIAQMQGNLTQVAKLNDETTAALNQVVELKKRQELARLQLQAQKQEKSKVVRNLSSQITSQRKEISKLTRDEKNLSQLVERLAKIIPKTNLRKTKPPKNSIVKNSTKNDVNKVNGPANRNENNQIDESAEHSEQTSIASNNELPNQAFSGVDFATLKGKLRLPVRGEVTNRFGASREDSGISWKGLFIKSAEGSEVKSVASGRVVFADWMRGFGNLIIIDHGNGYMSLYGNNQTVLRKVGDEVSGGDAIAAVGNSGGNLMNGLYYELRKQSKPFDPMSWSVVR